MPSRLPSKPRSISRSAPGFTMIELLTAIAIIAIISGILVLSLGKVGASRQRDQTVVLLGRLNNALTEVTNSPQGAQKLYTIQLPAIYFPPKTTTDYDFPNSNYKTWIGVPASAVESQIRTAIVLKQVLASTPASKAILGDLPPERQKDITWNVTDAQVPGSKILTDATHTNPHYTMPLDSWGNPILFVYDNLQIATGTNVGRPFTVNLGTGPETEVGGAINMYSVAEKTFYEPAQDLTPAPLDTSTTVTTSPNPQPHYMKSSSTTDRNTYVVRVGPTGTNEYQFRSPDHHPFWMSAGPDGKYETIDDNVFSFGN